ncbi:hypothetical protein PBRA_003458 [Plasmodiophora brassicae]|uniref:SUEL-type lectin domain-containing protein n=1 Tax=Plasmodiophora brassicae TaxID=37360 RepID=A0A0G4J920_PLABS|nr:hypothetical protein PBRA_003458 [Plasmodiophora brassicae]
MQCDAGTYISSVTFASWGTPIGQSPPFQVSSSCAYKNSVAVVQSSCQYQTGCTLQATSAFFGSDPCPGTAKSLAVEMTCSITPPQTSCTGGVRVDGRCGSAAFGWANCAFGQCCSPTNWCGTTPQHCAVPICTPATSAPTTTMTWAPTTTTTTNPPLPSTRRISTRPSARSKRTSTHSATRFKSRPPLRRSSAKLTRPAPLTKVPHPTTPATIVKTTPGAPVRRSPSAKPWDKFTSMPLAKTSALTASKPRSSPVGSPYTWLIVPGVPGGAASSSTATHATLPSSSFVIWGTLSVLFVLVIAAALYLLSTFAPRHQSSPPGRSPLYQAPERRPEPLSSPVDTLDTFQHGEAVYVGRLQQRQPPAL